MINLRNKIVVITGSSSGIGLKLCKKFLPLKCKVIGFSRKQTKISHKNFVNFIGDQNNYYDIKNFQKYLKTKFRKVDILINNAGITKPGYDEKSIKTNIKIILFLLLTLHMNY